MPDTEYRLSQNVLQRMEKYAYREVIAVVPRIDQALGVAPTAICY
jgi:hypothetical protein